MVSASDDDPTVADLTAMFAPHLILPAQFTFPQTIHCPEKTLMLAVLEQAWQDAVSLKAVPEAKKLRLAARWWIADDDLDWPYSFRRICDAVGISAQAFRAAVASSDRHPIIIRKRSACYGGMPPQPMPYKKLG